MSLNDWMLTDNDEQWMQVMMRRSDPELQAFLTTEEVLGYLKTTPRTIYRLIRSGELPAVRIGRQWRFRRVDLDRWVERQAAN
jgi:excisionase family DNA binding protein